MLEVKSEQLACNIAIDYSQVGGDPILPFIIELDLQASNLQPGPSENQRFCYNITGVGQDTREYADLSHFVLGICSEITEEEIVNVSVVIDGVEQEVIFGENVELRPPSNPDPPTGCAGLKFDFGLDKVEGEMTVCFELTRPYPIGSNEVCLFGGGRTARGLSICGPVCEETENTCDVVVYQKSKVCVPVTITTFVDSLHPTVYCYGDPVITSGTDICQGTENGSCTFTVTQKICIAVPLKFGANAIVGNLFVQCGNISTEEGCGECGPGNNRNSGNSDKSSSDYKKKKGCREFLDYFKL